MSISKQLLKHHIIQSGAPVKKAQFKESVFRVMCICIHMTLARWDEMRWEEMRGRESECWKEVGSHFLFVFYMILKIVWKDHKRSKIFRHLLGIKLLQWGLLTVLEAPLCETMQSERKSNRIIRYVSKICLQLFGNKSMIIELASDYCELRGYLWCQICPDKLNNLLTILYYTWWAVYFKHLLNWNEIH